MDVQRELERAKCLEQAELYDDMKDSMKKVVESGHDLKTEDRNLLSVAYKNVVGKQRSVWRIISAKEPKYQSEKITQVEQEEFGKIKEKTEENLKIICREVVGLIDKHLISSATDDESKVFYHKMKGDYFRYLAEVGTGDKKQEDEKSASDAYEAAQKVAEDKLASTHPIRLGLALNYSVFYYEIKNQPDKACQLAKNAFDDAIADLDQLKVESYKDSTLIMQLLRDNLTLWTADNQGDNDGDEGD
ncbi:14-3-3-like protein [Dysidea avara]|uniref:14-3-3-like protein n=1 Tax=Dysidea avara TaxID=196820 RepID=UPI003322FBA1